jgi:LmbE family N-acetylglucosaminyl deacetylase
LVGAKLESVLGKKELPFADPLRRLVPNPGGKTRTNGHPDRKLPAMNPYRTWVADLERLLNEGKRHPLGGLERLTRPEIAPNAPIALIFAPHPDDEAIIGAMPLRLLRESRYRIVNVAVTQGSNPARRDERWRELDGACGYLGFELLATAPGGLQQVNLETRHRDPAGWAERVATIAAILSRHAPAVVFLPHSGDWHTTHVGTHHLVVDALASLGDGFQCYAVETEIWRASSSPNLMVESSADDVADLVAALTFHVGEVTRNPYHLTLPAHMIDSARRGAELVLGQGHAAPPFTFATLYRLRKWQNGRFVRALAGGRAVSAREPLRELLD